MTDEVEILCELCGGKSDIDFNCIIPRGEKSYFLKSNICFDCFGDAPSDYILAIKIIKKRNDNEPGYKNRFLEDAEI